jgi:ribose transport system substrate-binding protein
MAEDSEKGTSHEERTGMTKQNRESPRKSVVRRGGPRGTVAVVVLLVIACLVAACGSSDSTTEKAASTTTAAVAHKGKKVAIVIPDPSGAYKQMACGARQEGQRLGFDVGQPQAPAKVFDVAGEAHILEAVLATKPAGLIYTPADASAGAAGINSAATDGLPVVNVDAQLKDSSLYISYVGSSGVAGAKAGGELLAKQIGESGKVAAIGILPDNPITVARIGGFREAMKEFPNIQVVSIGYPDVDVNKIAAEATALLTKHPDLKAIYTTNDLIATGVGTALRGAGKSGKVKMVTWDLSPPGIKLLKAGTATGSVVQKVRQWGVLAIQQLANKLDGKPVDKSVTIPTVTVTNANINDPATKALYYTAAC